MALPPTVQPQSIALAGVFVDEVQEAWKRHCGKLREQDRAEFEKHACNSIQEYLEKLEKACQSYADSSPVTRIMEWFEPLYKAFEFTTPAAAVAIQAYPNPGSLVLGGIVGLLSITNRVIQYQKLSLRMLARMGRKAKIVLNYEKDMFKDDKDVKAALFDVYSDILAFCNKAFRFLIKKNGSLHARVRGFRLLAVRDFESHFEKEIQNFEDHIDSLEKQACLCFRRFVGAVAERQHQYHKKLDVAMDSAHDHFQRQTSMAEVLIREQSLRQTQAERAQRQDNQRVLEWLSPLNLTAHYDKACEEHLPGTGSWLLESDTYKDWKTQESSDILWITGKPGCGKSILAAVVIMDLKSDPVLDAHTAYAFCRSEEETSGDPTVIMAALAKQLGYNISGLASKLENDQFKTKAPTHKRLQEVMALFLTHLKKTYLVIDGLDESKDSDVLAKDLLALVHLRNKFQLKIIVFSRLDFHLDRHFELYAQLRVDLGANAEDLEAYIKHCFPDEPPHNVNGQIRSLCKEKAEGMFLWVKLLSQQLEKENLHGGHKLTRVHKIPPGLDQLYEDILGTIWNMSEDVRSIAFLILIWVLHARRPLTGPELLEAVADYSQAKKMRDVHRYPKPQRLVVLCLNLVYIDTEGFFRVCHESVRDYLSPKGETSPTQNQPLAEFRNLQLEAHTLLAEVCLSYLHLDDFVPVSPKKMYWEIARIAEEFPFLLYAAKFWGDHASNGNSNALWGSITSLLDLAIRRELICAAYFYNSRGPDILPARSVNSLHVLCLFDIEHIARQIPNVGLLLTVRDATGWLPVEYAFYKGHRKMCLWLVGNSQTMQALLDHPMKRLKAMHRSARLGWSDVLKLLLIQDDPLVNTLLPEGGDSALTRACFSRDIMSVIALLNSHADVNLVGATGHAPLHTAILMEDEAIVDVLLQSGARPDNRCTKYGATALQMAATTKNTAIAKLILATDEGARMPSLKDYQEDTPFHDAANANCDEIIKIMHAVYPEIGYANGDGDTPLHLAARSGSSKAAAILLELGAHQDAVNKRGLPAITDAVKAGSLRTLQILIRRGCDVKIADNNGVTALLEAASEGRTLMIEHILKSQPGNSWNYLLNQQDIEGNGPLHLAILNGHTHTAEYLLSVGADASLSNTKGILPLHLAARRGNQDISSYLLAQTKDPNPLDKHGDTPLALAASFQSYEFVKQFCADCWRLGLNINFDAQLDGRTALTYAITRGDEKMADWLLEKTTIFPVDNFKQSPIHLASWSGLDSIVQKLLDRGVSTEKDHVGNTPLHFASFAGHLSVVKVLLNTPSTSINEMNELLCTPLLDAMSKEHFDVAEVLLEAGANHLCINLDGCNALHYAAAAGNVQMVSRLLSEAHEVDVKNIYGETALHYAITENQLEMVKFLINSGFDAEARDIEGKGCLAIAAACGHIEIMQELAQHGARFNTTDIRGRSSAWWAASSGHDTALKLLHENGEDLTRVDSNGFPLWVPAIWGGHLAAFKYLLKTLANNVNEQDGNGQLPITLAAQGRYPNILRELLQAQADPHLCDYVGLTAVDYARNHPAMMRELLKRPCFWEGNKSISQPALISNTIKTLSERILPLSSDPSQAAFDRRLVTVSTLADVLRYTGNMEAATQCYVERLSHNQYISSQQEAVCEICWTLRFEDVGFVCSSCYRPTFLCEDCFRGYQNAGRRVPLAVRRLQNLQDAVHKLRVGLTDQLSLMEANRVCGLFGREFIETLHELFAHWNIRYNSENEYDKALRNYGSSEFVDILEQASKLWPQNAPEFLEPLNASEWSKLEQRYLELQKSHKASQEIRRFECWHHTYLEIPIFREGTDDTHSQYLDKDTGMLPNSFFESLVRKYGGEEDQGPVRNTPSRRPYLAPHQIPVDSPTSRASNLYTNIQLTQRSRRASLAAGELRSCHDEWTSEPNRNTTIQNTCRWGVSRGSCVRQRARASSMPTLSQTGDWKAKLARESDDLIAAKSGVAEEGITIPIPPIHGGPVQDVSYEVPGSELSDVTSDDELFSLSRVLLQYSWRKPVNDAWAKAQAISVKLRESFDPGSLEHFRQYCQGIKEVEAEKYNADTEGIDESMRAVAVDTDTDSESGSDSDDSQ